MQTAAIRHELGDQHMYTFVDGAVPAAMAPGIGLVSDTKDEFLQYADFRSIESCRKALQDLRKLLEDEGPFEGVMAFSQGASLVASLMVRQFQEGSHNEQFRPIFRCAVFFCGGIPEDPSRESSADRRLLNFESDGELIQIPTAHIWGASDLLYPSYGPVLSKLCRHDLRDDFIHEGGHEIPGAKDQDAVLKAVRVIKRAIERANES